MAIPSLPLSFPSAQSGPGYRFNLFVRSLAFAFAGLPDEKDLHYYPYRISIKAHDRQIDP